MVETNIAWLRQALALLDRIDEITYATVPPQAAPHRVGGHIRHIVEFYECFLDGLESCHIDYDARIRDEAVEKQRGVAMARIRRIIERLETSTVLREDGMVWVRMEDAPAECDCFLTSSVGRELQVLSSHTIHHFALVAITLRLAGVLVDDNFGMAPSTLRYMASKAA